MLAVYGTVIGLGLLLQATADSRLQAFGLGLALPGAGFLHWLGDGGSAAALLLMLGAACLFGISLVVWFGTGNILLPPAIWLASAVVASGAGPWLEGDGANRTAVPISLLLALAAATLAALLVLRRPTDGSTQERHTAVELEAPVVAAAPAFRMPELDADALGLTSLLLDRAQQPIAAFDGFEWRDQFQTAAIRYQLNFMSYALAMVQANHLPASGDYLAGAQANLLAKLGDHRVWRYWALENAWGRLRFASDPVPVDNIMYTGFIAAQMVYAEHGGTRLDPLQLRDRRGDRERYTVEALVALLAAQYERAPFGLLACEPNWIYPLCNAITATAIKGHDARHGTSEWSRISASFRHGLVTEFMTASGDIVPFRSSVTGIAPPALGGAVMQAFPSFFLNSLFPDIAAMQWERLRSTVARKGLKRVFWPIDVGNYGFSRASSYAAGANAAIEMGDRDIGEQLLSALDAECPAIDDRGARHRPRASLWSHALELSARAGRTNGLRDLVCTPPDAPTGPHLHDVRYPEIRVARAVGSAGRLEAVLFPGNAAGRSGIGIAGLIPGRSYTVAGSGDRVPRLERARPGLARCRPRRPGRTFRLSSFMKRDQR